MVGFYLNIRPLVVFYYVLAFVSIVRCSTGESGFVARRLDSRGLQHMESLSECGEGKNDMRLYLINEVLHRHSYSRSSVTGQQQTKGSPYAVCVCVCVCTGSICVGFGGTQVDIHT
ncbi:hypothetical protein QQF64_008871 [Cirrhinus molitorella]|uniref:Secreted protein n=1 Tax=Cirrhinus molitorella TaxID=172907 RepID=A0ABR3MAR8_9TELE